MRLNLLMSFAYRYDYPIEIFVTYTVEGEVSRGDERYLYVTLINDDEIANFYLSYFLFL